MVDVDDAPRGERRDSPWLHKLPPARKFSKKRGRPGSLKFGAEADACRRRPGVWLLLSKQQRNCYILADKVRDGRLAAFRPKGHWRVAVRESHLSRDLETGRKVWTGDVFVSYDPPPLTVEQLEADTEFPATGADPWELVVNRNTK